MGINQVLKKTVLRFRDPYVASKGCFCYFNEISLTQSSILLLLLKWLFCSRYDNIWHCLATTACKPCFVLNVINWIVRGITLDFHPFDATYISRHLNCILTSYLVTTVFQFNYFFSNYVYIAMRTPWLLM